MAMLRGLLLLQHVVLLGQALEVRDKEGHKQCCYCEKSAKKLPAVLGSCPYPSFSFVKGILDFGDCRLHECGIRKTIKHSYNRECLYFGDGPMSYLLLGKSHESFFESKAMKDALKSVVHNVSKVKVGEPDVSKLAADFRKALEDERKTRIQDRWGGSDKEYLANLIEGQCLPPPNWEKEKEVTYTYEEEKWEGRRKLWDQFFCGEGALKRRCGPIPANVKEACEFGRQRVKDEGSPAAIYEKVERYKEKAEKEKAEEKKRAKKEREAQNEKYDKEAEENKKNADKAAGGHA